MLTAESDVVPAHIEAGAHDDFAPEWRLKRAVDVVVAGGLLAVTSPALAMIALAVRRDGGAAIYRAPRVGRDGTPFQMFKFRTMVVDADRIGPPSASDDDARITSIGRCLRRFKLDELPQLLNVVAGDMSLVGPRPEVAQEVATYDDGERAILQLRPGMTDYSSIVFSNEGALLRGSPDPHAAYCRLIRPGKLRLGLEYGRRRSARTDLTILGLTALAIVRPHAAGRAVCRIVPGVRELVPHLR